MLCYSPCMNRTLHLYFYIFLSLSLNMAFNRVTETILYTKRRGSVKTIKWRFVQAVFIYLNTPVELIRGMMNLCPILEMLPNSHSKFSINSNISIIISIYQQSISNLNVFSAQKVLETKDVISCENGQTTGRKIMAK